MKPDTPAARGELSAAGLRFGVVTARFHSQITDRLAEGAIDALRARGATDTAITQVWVPGAFELPVVLERLARSGSVDVLIALGCVIRGETPHFDVVVATCAHGCEAVARNHGLPVGFGLITADTLAQADDRAGGAVGNKGEEAALAALETAIVLRGL